jgi:hypothetical protein
MNSRRICTLPVAGLLILTALAWAVPSTAALARASVKACHRYPSIGDIDARMLAREAELAAEVLATDHQGLYTSVSTATLHAFAPSIPISSRQAHHARMSAYLPSASGTRRSYVLTTRSLNGDTYTIQRERSGKIERHARVCGTQRHW